VLALCKWCDLTEAAVSPPVTAVSLPGVARAKWAAGDCAMCAGDGERLIVIESGTDGEDYCVMMCEACLEAGAAVDDVPPERFQLLYTLVPN
jgi:hypothetical protein